MRHAIKYWRSEAVCCCFKLLLFLQALVKKLTSYYISEGRPQGIFHARVPIVKFVDAQTGDLTCSKSQHFADSFNKTTGIPVNFYWAATANKKIIRVSGSHEHDCKESL